MPRALLASRSFWRLSVVSPGLAREPTWEAMMRVPRSLALRKALQARCLARPVARSLVPRMVCPVQHVRSFAVAANTGHSEERAEKAEAAEKEFTDATAAFESKNRWELFRAWCIFQTCAIGPIVRHCDTLYEYSVKILGARLTHFLLKKTFFEHFCAGVNSEDIRPRMIELQKLGVGGILDYAAEAKDGELPVTEKPEDEEETVGAPLSSRTYDYEGEALCDARAQIFRTAVRAVKDATPDGFAAIKLSGLGNPALLERMSMCLAEVTRLYARLAKEDISPTDPFYMIDRSFRIDFETFKKGWLNMFEGKSEDELKAMFDAMDRDGDGYISYLEWSSGVKLSEINEMVRGCKHQGRLYQAALNEEEVKLYGRNMLKRVQSILDLAQELSSEIDAEWTDIQPAIDHITIFMQRIYNQGDLPIVFNTYQTYLKGMPTRVQRDLDRSRREGWRFGAKLVRGAYMVSERKKAAERGLQSPICESYEDTEENFHLAIDAILNHEEERDMGPGGAPAEMLVASHNRHSIERTIRKMAELGVAQDRVGFGQLMGMADHLTFTLARYGYKSYKYVPYGPVDEVVPYLIRRTQENSAILGSPSVQEERRLARDFEGLFPDRQLLKEPHVLVTLALQTKHRQSAMSAEMLSERQVCYEKLVTRMQAFKQHFDSLGRWCDFIDPSTGAPFHSDSSTTLLECDECYRRLGFEILELGCCKALCNKRFGQCLVMTTAFVQGEDVEAALPLLDPEAEAGKGEPDALEATGAAEPSGGDAPEAKDAGAAEPSAGDAPEAKDAGPGGCVVT
ncbi:unnamed protein product [Effrenium voratum]|nr:unnamed protein product [Effrenium voratum]